MPIRITRTLPELKPLGLFKNTRGTLVTWTLSAADIARSTLREDLRGHLEATLRPCDARHRMHPPNRPTIRKLEAQGRCDHISTRFSNCIGFFGHGSFLHGIDSSSLHLRPRCVGCHPFQGCAAEWLHVPFHVSNEAKTFASHNRFHRTY